MWSPVWKNSFKIKQAVEAWWNSPLIWLLQLQICAFRSSAGYLRLIRPTPLLFLPLKTQDLHCCWEQHWGANHKREPLWIPQGERLKSLNPSPSNFHLNLLRKANVTASKGAVFEAWVFRRGPFEAQGTKCGQHKFTENKFYLTDVVCNYLQLELTSSFVFWKAND